MAQEQPVGPFGELLNAIWKKVPSQLDSVFTKGFGSLLPYGCSLFILRVGEPN